MSEQDESPVNRRQFFRDVTGGLFKAIGEFSGLDKLIEEEVPMLSFTEDDVIVPPEKQAESLSMIFGFLEQQAAEQAEPVAVAEVEPEPGPDAGVAEPSEAESQPD